MNLWSAAVNDSFKQVDAILKDTYTHEGVHIWLTGKNRNLDGQRPMDLICNGGDAGRAVVLEAARRIEADQ